jgi:hypothetical protein
MARGNVSCILKDKSGLTVIEYVFDVDKEKLMVCRGTAPTNPGWTRTYNYNEHGLIEPAETNNRLSRTQTGSGPIEPY